MKPNFRYDIRSAQTMVNRDKLDPMWVDFVQYHISPAFYQACDFAANGQTHSPGVQDAPS